jgi:hypothetical protein
MQIRKNEKIEKFGTINSTNSTIFKHEELKCSFYANQQNVTNASTDKFKTYLTIAGQLISIACLLMLLGMYFSHRILRNLPGLVLISLSVALMMSQVNFLISTYLTESFIAKSKADEICLSNHFNTSNFIKIKLI